MPDNLRAQGAQDGPHWQEYPIGFRNERPDDDESNSAEADPA